LSARLLTKVQLLQLMRLVSNPKRHQLTQQELEKAIEDFCAGCPDPMDAASLIAESEERMSDEEVVDRALRMAYVPIASVPISIVHADHPARFGFN
jgi:hypothetical protein